MTRRERRLFEQSASQAVPTLNAAYPPTSPAPLVQEPVAPIVAPPPMTRRERRALENESPGSPPPVTPVETSGTPVTPVGAAATELWPPQVGPSTAPSGAILPDPLPPVFGAATATPAPEFSPSRTVGSVSSATSSLILPHTPTIDIAGPLGNTGEIVVTGQIMLPASLAERGGAPALVEDRDQDEVMDAYVTGAIAPTAKPMRASQAVSTKGDDTDIVLVRQARWGTATVVTGLSAAVLGLAALGLLVLAMLTDVVG